jgi:hypothetical protein
MKNLIQFTLVSQDEAETIQHYKKAIRKYFAAVDSADKEQAVAEMTTARDVLVLRYNFTIPQIAVLADEARSGDAA